MKRSSKIILQLTAGIALAVGGLYIFFRKSDDGQGGIFESLVREIAGTSGLSIVACIALIVLMTCLRALRWRIMLPDAAGLRHKRGLFSIVAVSQMANNILPARLGDAARAVLLWKRNNYPITASVGSLIIERILDSMAYLLFIVIPVLLAPRLSINLLDKHPATMAVVWCAAALIAAMAAMFALYIVRPCRFRAAALRVVSALPKKYAARARKAGSEARSCLDWTSSFGKTAAVSLLTLATALCFSSMIWVLLGESVGFLGSLFAQSFAALGAAIPLAPGFVGTLHAALLQGLSIIGVPLGKARAAVVLYHAVGYVVQTILGLALFAALHVKFKDITVSNKETE